jgi:hypothetical protein
MRLKFLDPEIARKLMEGHEDVVTPAAKASERFYAAQSCIRCGGSCRKVGDVRTMFQQGEIMPQYRLECLACGCEFNPHSGMIVKMGNLGEALEPAVPLLDGPDD